MLRGSGSGACASLSAGLVEGGGLVPLSYGAMRATNKRARLFRHTFPLQRLAFEYADGAADPEAAIFPHIRVFSYQVPGTGKRRFLAWKGELSEFVAKYLSIPPLERHFYEIIRHGSPCRVYFDLEFATECNKDADGDQMTAHLVSCVVEELKQVYGVCVDSKNFIILDSTTPSKYSKHVVLNHPAAVFLDNSHAGAFARCCVDRGGKKLWVRKKESDETCCFVDLAVYTKNRAFRMYLSSKQGRAAVLEPCSSLNTFPFDDKTNEKVAEFLAASLVSVPGASVWECLVTSALESPSGKELEEKFGTGRRSSSSLSHTRKPHRQSRSRNGASSAHNSPPSPFPLLDEYVCGIANSFLSNPYAKVRSWTLDDAYLRLDIAFNRYCHRIKRAHKSNHVYYAVNLKERTVVQRCLDAECASFSSFPPWKIPDGILPSSGNSESLAEDHHSGSALKGVLAQLMTVRGDR